MAYHSRFRKWMSDSLLEGKVIFAVYLFLLVTFVVYPDLAVFISNYLGSLPVPGIGLLSGSTSLVIIPILGLIIYVGFIYLGVRILWAMDTSEFEDKINQNVAKIAELLGHSSYVQLKSDSGGKNFRMVLGTLPNSRPRWAWIQRALFGMFSHESTPIGIIRKSFGISIWKLFYLTNYVRMIETKMRQSTQAPTSILEYPIPISEIDFLFPKGIESPFTKEELEIISYRIDKEVAFTLRRRIQHRIKKRWISPIVLLEKGIVSRDYENGNVGRFVKVMTCLIESHDDERSDTTLPPIVSRESIASIVRFTDKQYDFKIGKRDVNQTAKDVWTLLWQGESSKNTFLVNDHKIANDSDCGMLKSESLYNEIFEIPHIDGFRFSLYKKKEPEPALASTSLDVEGYRVHNSGGSTSIQIADNINAVESLDRIQRLLLDDLFGAAIEGNILTIKDPSNLRMLIEAFINRQLAMNKALLPTTFTDPNKTAYALLSLNALGQTPDFPDLLNPSESLFKNMRIDNIKGAQTLATSGLLGLDCIKPDTKSKINAHIATRVSKSPAEYRNSIQAIRRASFPVHIPQLGLGGEHVLSENRRTEQITATNVLVWAATGAGAWIIERNHMSYFTQPIPTNEKRGLLLIHHPLREQVFLETLTHRNYHYVWEILRNRVHFQEMAPIAEADEAATINVEFVWVREAFLPSGNSFILNDASRQVLQEVTDVCEQEDTPRSDCCVMLTRSNQLIRGPVNGLNMIFAENKDSLSPLSAMTLDLVLRQRMHEEVARCFSNGTGLVHQGKATPLTYAVNWLKPQYDEDVQNLEMLFTSHSFADPATWNNLGFLDILVKETKCAYALIKVLSSYTSMLKNGERLPFRLVHSQADESKGQDIDHLTSSYDILCDFLTGEGDFSKSRVHAVGNDKGYLDWLEKTLLHLPAVGKALGCEDIFSQCIKECKKWLTKINEFLGSTRDPLKIRIIDILSKI